MAKKVCKECKIFVKGDKCPICNEGNFSDSFNGRIFVVDANKSVIAEKLNLKQKGEYAIKVK